MQTKQTNTIAGFKVATAVKAGIKGLVPPPGYHV
jgi:hypothetical protein